MYTRARLGTGPDMSDSLAEMRGGGSYGSRGWLEYGEDGWEGGKKRREGRGHGGDNSSRVRGLGGGVLLKDRGRGHQGHGGIAGRKDEKERKSNT